MWSILEGKENMGFIAFIAPAVTVLLWTIWGLAVFLVVNAVLISTFQQGCRAYFKHKLGFFQALHKQSQEDADEISSQFWQKMT
jgi:hypothetical protein